MAKLERELKKTIAAMEIRNCTDIEALKTVSLSMLELIERQHEMLDKMFKKGLGIEDDD